MSICALLLIPVFNVLAETNHIITSQDTELEAPVYWEGWAQCGTNKLYIKVYRNAYQCDSFYAVGVKFDEGGPTPEVSINQEFVVKERGDSYYVTYDGLDYRFNM